MPRNLEVKARIAALQDAEQIARSINANPAGYLYQIDTYFNVQRGRLKLREINRDHAELIYYSRNELSKCRESDYEVFTSPNISVLKKFLESSLGIRAIVRKQRKLYMYQSTRIHLDEVEQLGSFLELESPIEQSAEAAQKVVDFLLKEFGVRESDYILSSYVDLIMANDRSGKDKEPVP